MKNKTLEDCKADQETRYVLSNTDLMEQITASQDSYEAKKDSRLLLRINYSCLF